MTKGNIFHGVTDCGCHLPQHRPPPPGFVRRIAFSNADNFLTGTYTSGGKRIGDIRTPQITPNSPSLSH